MRSTLLQARMRCAKVANMAYNDARMVDIVNEAQEELLRMGRWWGTYQRIAITATEGLITWPRIVAAVEAVDVCASPVYIKNGWYEFMDESSGLRPDCCGQLVLIDREPGALALDIEGTDKKIRFYPRNATDATKTVIVQGEDANGIRVRTEYPASSGEYIDGEKVALVYPFATTSSVFSTVDGIQKAVTLDQVVVKEYDTVTAVSRQVSILDPDETVASYRRSFLDPFAQASGTGCTADEKLLTALVKLEYRPAIVDTDYLIIGNLGALKDMVQSLRHKENNQFELAVALQSTALRKLNHELRTMTGDRVSISMKTQGTAGQWKRSIGSMT